MLTLRRLFSRTTTGGLDGSRKCPEPMLRNKSREELLTSLSEALKDILELNAKDALDGVSGQFEEVALPA